MLITSQAIIDDTSINPSVADFIGHRQAQDLTTAVVSIEEILADAAYTGRDNAETLRNFIIDAYETLNTEYVLLAGDTNIIPLRRLWCYLRGQSEINLSVPSDLYYQCLDDDFNSDGDLLWGETTDGPGGTDVDLLAEIYVGRASAQNAEELSNFFYKTMAYENEADNASYLTRALLAGEWLGFGGVSEFSSNGLEEIRLGSDNYGYTTAGFAAFPNFTVDTLYDEGTENTITYSWSASDIITDINSNAYSIIVHDGHGDTDWVMRLANADADALTNTNFIFGYSHACFPGNYEAITDNFPEDCIAEHLTTSTRNGMFAVVYNSRFGWGMGNSTDGASQRLCRQFWDACFGEGMTDLGAMNADSHEDNLWDISDPYIRYSIYESNLLGDPATVLRGLPYLSIEIPTDAAEGDVLTDAGVVTADAPVTADLVVWLTSSDTTEATVPDSVTIPEGDSSVTFDITVPDDMEIEEVQTVFITAEAQGFIRAAGRIDIADTDTDDDGDNLSGALETLSCTDPYDADTDDDGITDGEEDANQNGMVDDGETDPCETDTDNDGIQDGTELGYTDGAGLDTDSNVFQPDQDPLSLTDPLDTDTDGDGLADGDEDANQNGRVDAGETDPTVNERPTADAGPDQTVDEGDRVDLDGTGSFDIDDGLISHVWTQTAGPTVTISNSHTAQAYFTAPDVTADQTLTFRLSVRDAAGQLVADTCTVNVRWDGAAPPDDDDDPPVAAGGGGGGGGCFIGTVR
ncbi:MAG: C25 family cysteine peptidase [Thermodesulfobacteriota bacterium]